MAASATYLVSREHFQCSICLEVLTAPVTLQCGHNFCKKCIVESWRISRKPQCALCKRLFDSRTELHVNTFIAEMVGQLRQLAAEKPTDVARAGEVPCDVCPGTKLKALKSCLVCLASYCETHLERHRTVPGLRKHKLVDPLGNLEGRVCTQHDELMELFCKTDRMCVCLLCKALDHESHNVVPLRDECEGKKIELERAEAEFQRMIQERQLKLQELRAWAKLNTEAADKYVADGMRVFTVLMQLVETGLVELIDKIKRKQERAANHTEGLIEQLDREISWLMRRSGEVKQLARSDDPLSLLQDLSSATASPPMTDLEGVSLCQPTSDGTVARAVARLMETFSKETRALLEAELKRVRQYAVDVTLDPDTAHPRLILSDDGKQVNHSKEQKTLPDNPERFSYCVIVLGRQSFSSGRFYFEVEVKGKTKWDLGVVSVSANRKGQVKASPRDGYWTLQLRNGNYVALADPDVVLSHRSRPQKVGVFADYEAGVVSFYDADAADVIYSFAGFAFADKLQPFFSPCFDHSGDNSAPLRICAVPKS